MTAPKLTAAEALGKAIDDHVHAYPDRTIHCEPTTVLSKLRALGFIVIAVPEVPPVALRAIALGMDEHPAREFHNTAEMLRRVAKAMEEQMTEDERGTLHVVAAAIRIGQLTCSLPAPARHGHVMRAMTDSGCNPSVDGDQGFLLSNGAFASRSEAMLIAINAGQLIPRKGGYMKGEISNHSDLFSEDVW